MSQYLNSTVRAIWYDTVKACLQLTNLTQVCTATLEYVLRTNPTLTVLVLLQPISTKYIAATLTRVTNERVV